MTTYKKVSVPQEIVDRIIAEAKQYKIEHNLSYSAMADPLQCSSWSLKSWLKGQNVPRNSNLVKLCKAGYSSVVLPEEMQKQAVQATLRDIDKANIIPRRYTKRINMPEMVSDRIKALLDVYIEELHVPRTYAEFNEARQEFISKLYYTCKQGE